jgi:hypothetical protein
MSIRLPLQGVLDVTNTDTGAGSVAGGYAYPFKIPQDCDNVVVKFAASVVAGGMSAVLQTSDDGGTTYYDVARTSIVSNSGATSVSPQLAQWLSAPVISAGINPIVISNAQAGSVLGGTIGTAGASVLGSRQVSGLPILGIQNRIFLIHSGTASSNNSRVQVLVNSQSSAGQ